MVGKISAVSRILIWAPSLAHQHLHHRATITVISFYFPDPKIKPEPPKFKVSLADQTVEQGEKLILETEVTGEVLFCFIWP